MSNLTTLIHYATISSNHCKKARIQKGIYIRKEKNETALYRAHHCLPKNSKKLTKNLLELVSEYSNDRDMR